MSLADDVYYGANKQNHMWPLLKCDVVPTLPI